jgi:hypothetical protein
MKVCVDCKYFSQDSIGLKVCTMDWTSKIDGEKKTGMFITEARYFYCGEAAFGFKLKEKMPDLGTEMILPGFGRVVFCEYDNAHPGPARFTFQSRE